jgi:hypothetical protein
LKQLWKGKKKGSLDISWCYHHHEQIEVKINAIKARLKPTLKLFLERPRYALIVSCALTSTGGYMRLAISMPALQKPIIYYFEIYMQTEIN